MMDLAEAKRLYDAAERDWEFHDASPAFRHFASWLEDNFANLLAELEQHNVQYAETPYGPLGIHFEER